MTTTQAHCTHTAGRCDRLVCDRERTPVRTSGFACMECGHKFRTIKAAEKAAFGDSGCPKCGGSDIDLG